jgi:carbonic anhydrase
MKRSLLSLAVVALLSTAARAEEHHWGYEAKNGPEHWGAEAPACKTGKHQSPIDIKTAGKAAAKASKALPALQLKGWGKTSGKLVNNGHTFQVNLDEKSTATAEFGQGVYKLAQFHFHAKSEHKLNGQHSPMEVHFVHKQGDKLAVVGILLDDSGAANAAFKPVFDGFGKATAAKDGIAIEVDLSKLAPKKLGYFTYPGSLTTPPCSEGVHWMVLGQKEHLSKAQVAAFNKAFPHGNARPAQALNDRTVEVAQ